MQAFKELDPASENTSKQIVNQKRHRRLQEKSQKAFRKWLEASNKWILAKHRVQYSNESDRNAAQRLARKLKKRVDEAAEAYEAARMKIYSDRDLE